MEGGKESRGGRRRRAEPKQREMTVCLVRAAHYLEHSNLPPLGRLPVTSNKMDGGRLETEAVVYKWFPYICGLTCIFDPI